MTAFEDVFVLKALWPSLVDTYPSTVPELPVSSIFSFNKSSGLAADRKTFQLPRMKQQCPKCDSTEAVFFQSQQRTSDTGMVSFLSCALPKV